VTLIIAIIALLSCPLFIYLLNRYPRRRYIAFIAISALSLLPNIPIGFIYGWPAWRGPVLGFGIPFSFIIALAVIFTRPKMLGKIPFIGIISFFAFSVFLSIFFARMWLPSVFTLWQVSLVFVIFIAIAGDAHKAIIRNAVFTGFSLGLIFQAANSILQRAGGAAQASGTFGHQNILGLAVELTLIPILGAALSGRRSLAGTAGIIAGAICVASSGSRATMGIAAASILVLAAFSVLRRVTPQKVRTISVGLILVAIATPLALGSLNARFQGQTYFTSDLERIRFEAAATRIADNNPLGVGANNYVFVSNSEGYADDAGIGWQRSNRSVPVHNAYLLSRAEIGRVGEISFILIILIPLIFGIQRAFKERKSADGDILLGSVVALMANMIHNFYEFAVHTYLIQSLLFINLGLIAAAIRKQEMLRLWRSRMRAGAARYRIPEGAPQEAFSDN